MLSIVVFYVKKSLSESVVQQRTASEFRAGVSADDNSYNMEMDLSSSESLKAVFWWISF